MKTVSGVRATGPLRWTALKFSMRQDRRKKERVIGSSLARGRGRSIPSILAAWPVISKSSHRRPGDHPRRSPGARADRGAGPPRSPHPETPASSSSDSRHPIRDPPAPAAGAGRPRPDRHRAAGRRSGSGRDRGRDGGASGPGRERPGWSRGARPNGSGPESGGAQEVQEFRSDRWPSLAVRPPAVLAVGDRVVPRSLVESRSPAGLAAQGSAV